MGILTVMVVPMPTWLAARIVPLCAWAARWQRLRFVNSPAWISQLNSSRRALRIRLHMKVLSFTRSQLYNM
jgi:hypothetical protein